MAKAVGDSYAKLLKDLMGVRVDALIDGFELYGVSITNDLMNLIVKDATDFRAQYGPNLVKSMSAKAPHVAAMATHIVERVAVPVAAIRCQIEERRARPKLAPQQPHVTNVYHVSGPNARLNVQSTDQSGGLNGSTQHQLEVHLREPRTLKSLASVKSNKNTTLYRSNEYKHGKAVLFAGSIVQSVAWRVLHRPVELAP